MAREKRSVSLASSSWPRNGSRSSQVSTRVRPEGVCIQASMAPATKEKQNTDRQPPVSDSSASAEEDLHGCRDFPSVRLE